VLAGIGFRHQHPDVAPGEFRGAIAENPLGRRVDRADPAIAVDDDDRVERRPDDRAEQRVAVLGRAGGKRRHGRVIAVQRPTRWAIKCGNTSPQP